MRGLLCSPAVPPGLSMCECGATGSASGRTDCPVCPTIRQSLGPAALLRVLSAPAACLLPSYWSGLMFLLYLLGCWTSLQFDFLSVLVCFFFFKCCCLSLGCVRRRSVSTYASIFVSSPQEFSVRGLRLYFPTLKPCGCPGVVFSVA